MNYKTLSHFSLQSLTDSESYKNIAPIATMSHTAVIPEQSAVWCIPKKENTLGEISINMVNAMFGRMHLSGETPWLSAEQKETVKEGVDFYKSIRSLIPNAEAFYPAGIADFKSQWNICGFSDGREKYVSIVNLEDAERISIPLKCKAEQIYPAKIQAEIETNGNNLSVALPEKSAVIIKLKQFCG